MNGLAASITELDRLIAGLTGQAVAADVMVCPPATLIAAFAVRAKGSGVLIGGQDCHAEISGAFTGDISAEMLRDAGASAVIVGHSERRTLHGETDSDVNGKARAAWRAGLTAIVCVGESLAEHDAGHTLDVVTRQIAGSIPDGCDGRRIWWSPTNRCGPSARARPRPRPTWRRFTARSGIACASFPFRWAKAPASSMAGR